MSSRGEYQGFAFMCRISSFRSSATSCRRRSVRGRSAGRPPRRSRRPCARSRRPLIRAKRSSRLLCTSRCTPKGPCTTVSISLSRPSSRASWSPPTGGFTARWRIPRGGPCCAGWKTCEGLSTANRARREDSGTEETAPPFPKRRGRGTARRTRDRGPTPQDGRGVPGSGQPVPAVPFLTPPQSRPSVLQSPQFPGFFASCGGFWLPGGLVVAFRPVARRACWREAGHGGGIRGCFGGGGRARV